MMRINSGSGLVVSPSLQRVISELKRWGKSAFDDLRRFAMSALRRCPQKIVEAGGLLGKTTTGQPECVSLSADICASIAPPRPVQACRGDWFLSLSRSALASFREVVSKPSLNQL